MIKSSNVNSSDESKGKNKRSEKSKGESHLGSYNSYSGSKEM